MNATIMKEQKMVAIIEGGTVGFRRCIRRSFVPSFLCYVIAVLVLVAKPQEFCCCQPVTAFTTSRTATVLGLYRHRINNTSVSTILGTTAHSKNGISDSEENEGHAVPAPSHRPTTSQSDASRSSIAGAVAAAYTLCSSPVQRVRSWNNQVRKGYSRRVNADPSFFGKSITEVLVAAGTQLMAEWNRRGASRMILELDFILPAVLTAVLGKYYSMWRTAKTLDGDDDENYKMDGSSSTANQDAGGDPMLFGLPVPTNAFQPHMADGVTVPTTKQRMGSFLAPVPALFKAGMIFSGVGYGIVTFLLALRTLLVPSHQTETIPVNVIYASIYTGSFMAVVSNLRYQVLQGLVEPILIDRWIFSGLGRGTTDDDDQNHGTGSDNKKVRQLLVVLRSVLIFEVRWLNGLLGSVLAISGMRMFGLQRLKSS